MPTLLTSIADFELANPAYAGAAVSFFTVTGNGVATAILAALFTDPLGTLPAANPQVLDSSGKFAQPIYTGVPVIAQVSGLNAPSSTTGVINGAALATPFITPQMYGAKGDGATDDSTAIIAAQTAAVAAGTGLYFAPGKFAIAASIALTVALTLAPGAILQPAATKTVTVTGPVTAGPWQIVDAANGTVDFTKSPSIAYIEWWGVIGGDAAFNATNAAANKPPIDAALAHGPATIRFWTYGVYSTTGHVLPDLAIQRPITLEGIGLGGGAKTVGIIGSGIAAADAAHMGTDPSAHLLYTFQTGPVGDSNRITFKNLSVYADDMTNGAGLGLLFSTVANYDGYVDIDGGYFSGYFGIHAMKCYGGLWRNFYAEGNGLTVNGNFTSGSGGAAIAMTAPNLTEPDGQDPAIVRVTIENPNLSMSGSASGTLVYQSVGVSSSQILGLTWLGGTYIAAYDGFVLAALYQTFIGPELESISHTLLSEGAGSAYSSTWIAPAFAGGNTVAQLLSGKSVSSFVLSRNQIGGDPFLGSYGIATTATGGFPRVPVIAGAPTGVPGSTLGTSEAPFVYDSTNHKIWVYDYLAAAWKGVAVA